MDGETAGRQRRRPHGGDGAGFLLLSDAEGLRHLVRISAIQILSDADPCRDSTLAIIAGRPIALPIPLELLMARLGR